MKPAPFEYTKPKTLQDALDRISNPDKEVKILAGGQSLVSMMNYRMAAPELLVDINDIVELNYIIEKNDKIHIGALARHNDVYDSILVKNNVPLVNDAYRYVAHHTIRNRGTLCGNLCHADPASEMPSVMIATDAVFVLRSYNSAREISAKSFFEGIYTTALQPDEILTEVILPKFDINTGYAFGEISIRKGDFAQALVCAVINLNGSKIINAKLVCGGLSDKPILIDGDGLGILRGELTNDLVNNVSALVSSTVDVVSDMHGSTSYKRSLIKQLVQQSLVKAYKSAGYEVV